MQNRYDGTTAAGRIAGVVGAATTAYAIAKARGEDDTKATAEGISELVKKTVETAISYYSESRTRRWENFFHKLLTSSDGRADAVIRDILAEPNHSASARETLMWSLRTLDEMIDDCAVPPLVELARSYLGENRKPDWFFRGLRRLLSEISAEEIAALRELLDAIITNTTANGDDIIRINVSQPNKISIYSEPATTINVTSHQEVLHRSLHGLRANSLAYEARTRNDKGGLMATSSNVAEISRVVVLRIRAYIS